MRACWLKWVGRDWSISADYIWLNYSDASIAFILQMLVGLAGLQMVSLLEHRAMLIRSKLFR